MRVYIDRENLISFMKSPKDRSYRKCDQFLTEELDVHYNFTKESTKDDESLMSWVTHIAQGVQGEHKFIEKKSEIFPNRYKLKENFVNKDIEGLSSVYLLNEPKVCDAVATRCNVLIGKVGEEIDVLSQLDIYKEDIVEKITSWPDFCIKRPLTDIVMSDTYYFKNRVQYDMDDHSFLKTILPDTEVEHPVHIVIFTQTGNVGLDFNLRFEQSKMETALKELTHCDNSTVTLVVSAKRHARYAMTNYYRIKNDGVFNLLAYDPDKKDNSIEIVPHAKRMNETVTRKLLDKAQEILNDGNTSIYSSKKSGINLNRSNILHFND